jgi:outer membrane protein OmpA-like peptidoglycan-associated protein
MTSGMNKTCARLAVAMMVAFGASACSSVPDWVDPTNWGSDHAGPPPPAQTASDDATAPGETPDLASIPDRPAPSSTPDEQQQVANSLAADRSRAQYSADALRGGTEPVAAPPPPPSQAVADNATSAPPPPPTMPANTDINTTDTAPPPSSDVATNDMSSAPAAPDTSTQVASADLPSAPQTAPQMSAPPPAASAMPTPAQINPSDAALGFRPSSAPPLDASVTQFVPAPIVARYNQTANAAGLSSQPLQVAVAQPATKLKHRKSSTAGIGGPEKMSGSVVANLEVLQQTPQAAQASAYANPQGLPPTSVVFFPGDGTLLSAEGKARVRAAAEAFKQRGGQGFIRVVGHSSSRTSNMPLEQHLVVIFNKSQDRANAVAKELIRQGVPANQVLVEAVGDSQPVYYESMPKGEDGNRRAEIFLQS